MTGTGWFMELHGNSMDLDRLVRAFSSPPVTIVKEGESYRLRDESLCEIESAEEARTSLHRTLLRINALARIHRGGDHDDVAPGGLGHPNAEGGVKWFASATVRGRARVSAELTVIRDGEVVPPPPSPLPAQLELATQDEDVDDVLYFLQRGDPDWGELYKVYEIVRDDVGTIEGRGWASRAELTRFTHTANHQDGAGRSARHARLRADPPSDPMTLEEARSLIRRIVSGWLGEKLEPTSPEGK